MRARWTDVVVVGVLLAAVGCGERSQPLPPGPNMQVAALSVICNFKSLNQLATHYFPGPEAKAVRTLISQMQTAPAFSTTAKNRGFDVLSHIESNVNAGNTNAADASSLTNGLLACMFSSAEELPLAFPEDFTIATTPSEFGGYAVRGGAGDPTTAVLSRPLTAPFSGMVPRGTNTWPTILSGNTPARVLIYGRPGSTAVTYDWKVVPRNATFSPPVVVGVCVDADSNSTSLLHEEHVGLLPFVDAAFLNPATCISLASQSWGNRFASRLARWGLDFLARPLSASDFRNPGGLGGSTGGIGSEFGPQVVNTVTLTFTVPPSDVQVNQFITPAVVVQATDAATGDPIPNVSITLSALNNNGTPAELSGTLTQITDSIGNATFGDLKESKTGGYLLVASGTVIGRTAISVPAVNSVRFNVRP